MLSIEDQCALDAIEAELTRCDPYLADVLAFRTPRRSGRWTRRLCLAVLSLAAVAVFGSVWVGASVPSGPCPIDREMNNHAALAAAADLSHPMPDNVSCVVPAPGTPG
jgi:hypothetical protein